MNSIYEEQRNWTLQRLIASPTPRYAILAGKLLGNLAVVALQLTILFASFTVITSLVEGEALFIWGENVPALLAGVLGISLFVSGLGVLVVGVAKSPEQVQFFGPMVAATLGALGGSFGFRLPQEVAGFSPVWWGAEALVRLSNGDLAGLVTPLLVLYGSGVGAFLVGTILFRRRVDL
jgi:ABC-2 type transport system permease protein